LPEGVTKFDVGLFRKAQAKANEVSNPCHVGFLNGDHVGFISFHHLSDLGITKVGDGRERAFTSERGCRSKSDKSERSPMPTSH